MEPGKSRWFPSSEKRPVGIQPSMQVPLWWSIWALHKDSEKGLKRTRQGASTRWRGAVNIHVRSGVNRKQQALDTGLRQRPRSWTPHAKSLSPLSVQPIFPFWNLCQGGRILQAQMEVSPVLIRCILAQVGKGISANFAREAKMVQAVPNFWNRRYRTAHRWEVATGFMVTCMHNKHQDQPATPSREKRHAENKIKHTRTTCWQDSLAWRSSWSCGGGLIVELGYLVTFYKGTINVNIAL